MKQKDFIIIFAIVAISGVISLFVSKSLFGKGAQSITVEKVEPISSEFPQPDKRYFNSSAFDPTQLITIGTSTTTDPFKPSDNQQ